MTTLDLTSIETGELKTTLLLFEKLFENFPTRKDIDMTHYLSILTELYNRDPHTYFRKWYFFKTWSKATFEDWKKWGEFCEYLDTQMEVV